jgi:type VI secretion system protein ImpA
MSTEEQLQRLLTALDGTSPSGENLNYSVIYDTIREARRADDASLEQGEWAVAIKQAEWPRVADLCENALLHRTKDLQLAVWHSEACTRINGFDGLTFGLRLVAGLLDRFWASAYPQIVDDDVDERAAKLEWLNVQLGDAIRLVPLTAPLHGGYTWHQYRESREVENLALRSPELRQAAIADGKLAGDIFDRSVQHSGANWYQQLSERLDASRSTLHALEECVGKRFGVAAPSLGEIRSALIDCTDVTSRLLQQTGGHVEIDEATESPSDLPPSPEARSPLATTPTLAAQSPNRRGEAVQQLRAIAHYFRTYEPHSPVAPLVERAARWAEMPLEEWLQAVIKDDATLGHLKELLDIRAS